MARMSEGKETWHRLLQWDRGQAPSERLAAILLHGDGFQNIDPSHPLGGRDGKKDIVFFEKDRKWIAAIYFPRGQQSFKDIKDKFINDFAGVAANQATGFVFITNQELRLAERQQLCEIDTNVNIIIYHLESIATMLNSPVNYGVRLEFLDIEMTKEEQLSFFAAKDSLSISQKRSDLSLKGILENKPDLSAHAYRNNLTNSEFMQKKEQKIKQIYEQVKTIVVPQKSIIKPSKTKKADIQDKDSNLPKYMPSIGKIKPIDFSGLPDLSNLFTNKDVEVDSYMQKAIIDYCSNKDLSISNDFFLLGNLKKSISTTQFSFGNSSPMLTGASEEKAKYNLLKELYWEIHDYNEYYNYFSVLKEKCYVKCVISNTGTSFDEDIDIKLIFPKGCICHSRSLPIPGYAFIKIFNEKSLEQKLFMMEPLVDVDRFSNYPLVSTFHRSYMNIPSIFNGKSASEEYEEYKEAYNDAIEQIFCYDEFSDVDHDILSFNIPYLKQNTNMALPTILVFNNLPSEIEFEIRSKHTPDIVKGSVKVIEGK